MADQVNYIDPSHNQLPRTDWQILGELQLRVGSNPNGIINQWLTKVLGPFSLPDDLVNKILRSMEDAAVRILSPDIAERKFEYLDIVVLAPAGLASKGQTWGFFRVERTSADTKIENANGHCVEYYLYLDRKSREDEPMP